MQPKTLSLLGGQPFKVIVFLGAKQKIGVDLANAMQMLGSDGSYVQICGNGPNALDFHIAFALGELSASNPDSRFYIVSRDTGFDPLLRYVRKRGTKAVRLSSLEDLAAEAVLQEKLDMVVRNLASRGSARPRSVNALVNTIRTLFPPETPDSEVESLIAALVRDAYITIESELVSYG